MPSSSCIQFVCTFLLLLRINAQPIHSSPFSCRDQSNTPVDWFAFYKLPKYTDDIERSYKAGTGFFYLDVENKNWSLSDTGLDQHNQSVAYTLQQFYDHQDQASIMHVMYNDEHPSGPWTDVLGHTKGVVFFDGKRGVWLVHSVPKFPPNSSYDWPSNAYEYGQSGICVSFDIDQLPDIAMQLFFNRPYIYSFQVPPPFATRAPILTQLVAGEYQETEPFTRRVTLTSVQGQSFVSFAKTQNFDRDLYYDLVAPELNVSLNTETWQHGGGNLDSWCNVSHMQVHNIRSITLPMHGFSNMKDHSKFALTDYRSTHPQPWVCVGDINRQHHQMYRGGGTLCINDGQLWRTYNRTIGSTWPCKTTISNHISRFA